MIPILYGSQTGNGVFLARQLQNTLKNSFTSPIDSFDLENINDFPLVIFIVSTHGDGQCPFNMVKFYNFILNLRDQKVFKFKSAVLGLGDSSYQKFNYCARVLVEKLKSLGSEVLCKEFANAQDTNGMYDGYNRFKNQIENEVNRNISFNIDCTHKESHSPHLQATVIGNELVTAIDYPEKIYELTFSMPLTNFIPGDCISILPHNTVDLFNICRNFTHEQIEFLRTEIDFYATVHQPVFYELSKYTQSQVHKEKLIEISKDYDLYHSYVLVPRRNIIEIVEDFSLSIPFEFYKEYSRIMPRYFSFTKIRNEDHGSELDTQSNANSSIKDANGSELDTQSIATSSIKEDTASDLNPQDKCTRIIQDHGSELNAQSNANSSVKEDNKSILTASATYSVLYNLVEYSTYLKEKRKGLCSHFLQQLQPGQTIPVGIVKSNLFLNDKKMLFFCTGTGVTLPRSVVHHFKDKEIVIFYGFRKYNKDQLCASEFKNCKIYCASSRDDKKYIMDVYRENPVKNIEEWLVFVSGNCRLNKEIKKVLEEVHGKSIAFQSETW